MNKKVSNIKERLEKRFPFIAWIVRDDTDFIIIRGWTRIQNPLNLSRVDVSLRLWVPKAELDRRTNLSEYIHHTIADQLAHKLMEPQD